MPKVYSYYNFCSFLKDCFKRHHIEQQVFCRETGIDPAHLSRILNGKSNPTIKTIFKIVRHIDGVFISVDDDKLIKIDL